MKQHITPKQLNELSNKGIERLRKWWIKKGFEHPTHNDPKVYVLGLIQPLLSIGQMLEFLGGFPSLMFWVERQGWHIDSKFYKKTELCDALFEAVKEGLDK